MHYIYLYSIQYINNHSTEWSIQLPSQRNTHNRRLQLTSCYVYVDTYVHHGYSKLDRIALHYTTVDPCCVCVCVWCVYISNSRFVNTGETAQVVMILHTPLSSPVVRKNLKSVIILHQRDSSMCERVCVCVCV